MFGLPTSETIPEACRTEQDAWDDLIATIWAAVLGVLPRAEGCAIEVGPGASTKVARALAKVHFKRKLVSIDPSPEVIASLKNRLPALLPSCACDFLALPIEEALPHLPKNPDLLLISHAIDDMIMREAYRAAPEREAIFGWFAKDSYEPRVTDAYSRAWEALARDADALERVKEHVFNSLTAFLSSLSPRALVISQYPSATLREKELDALNDHSRDVFLRLKESLHGRLIAQNEVQETLNTVKNYNHQHIGCHILNASYWLVSSGFVK